MKVGWPGNKAEAHLLHLQFIDRDQKHEDPSAVMLASGSNCFNTPEDVSDHKTLTSRRS